MQSEWIEVRIPPASPTGAATAGGGARQRGPPRWPAGRLVLVVSVAPHPLLPARRRGPLLPGAHHHHRGGAGGPHRRAHARRVDDDQVPAGTQTGQRFRLRKRGLPRLERDGPRRPLFVEGAGLGAARGRRRSRRLLAEFARRNPRPRAERGLRQRFAGRRVAMARGRRRAEQPAGEPPAPGRGEAYMISVVAQQLRHPPADAAALRARGPAEAVAHGGQHAPLLRGRPAPAGGDPEPHAGPGREPGRASRSCSTCGGSWSRCRPTSASSCASSREELLRTSREGWEEKLEQALVRIPPQSAGPGPYPTRVEGPYNR